MIGGRWLRVKIARRRLSQGLAASNGKITLSHFGSSPHRRMLAMLRLNIS